MASLAIPLIASLAPEIISLIAGLAQPKIIAAEQINVPGPVRFADVFVETMSDLTKAHANGQIAGDLPNDAIVKVIIQAVFTSLSKSGIVNVPPMSVPAPATLRNATYTVHPGDTIMVSA